MGGIMTWDYRIVKDINDPIHGVEYGIHEVYYDEHGEPEAMSTERIPPAGETPGELRDDLIRMLMALLRPVFIPPKEWDKGE